MFVVITDCRYYCSLSPPTRVTMSDKERSQSKRHCCLFPRFFVNIFFQIILPTRFFKLKSWIYRNAGVAVGGDVKITSEVKIFGNGAINIGDKTWVGIGTEFHIPVPAKISIGNNCDIAPGVRFLCGSHLVGNSSQRAGKGIVDDIFVGACMNGAGTMLLPGTHLGYGIVVAAGSVVNKGQYPANGFLAGNPAQVKKNYA